MSSFIPTNISPTEEPDRFRIVTDRNFRLMANVIKDLDTKTSGLRNRGASNAFNGTVGTISKFGPTSHRQEDSIITESAAVITVTGDETITGTFNVDGLSSLDSVEMTSDSGIIRSVNSGVNILAGGNSITDGGVLTLYGSGHASKAGDIELDTGVTPVMVFDASESALVFEVADNISSPFKIGQSSNTYFLVSTLDSGGTVDIGNPTTNPTFRILGSGLTNIASLTASSLVATDGNKDLTSTTSGLSPTFANLTLTHASSAVRLIMLSNAASTLDIAADEDNDSADSDASIRLSNNGTNMGEIGIDDSDSDKIKVYAGTAGFAGGGLEIDQTTFKGTFTAALDIVGIVTLSSMTQGSVLFFGSGGVISEDNTNFLWDDTNNRLGLLTNAPEESLHVVGRAKVTSDIFLSGKLYLDGGSNTYISQVSADQIDIVTGGTEAVRILSNGKVGILTTVPEESLHVVGNVKITGGVFMSSTQKIFLDGGSNTYISEASADQMVFFTGGTEAVRITNTSVDSSRVLNVSDTTDASSLTVASAVIDGGAAIAKKLFIGSNLILPKTSGLGIQVDTTTPTFGFADLLGDQFSKNTGATKPTLAAHNGAVQAWQFGNGDEAYMTYHIPHDYVIGTDIFLHVHWDQTSTTATGGTIDFKYFAEYAKGHNQASGSTFTATPITATFSSININDGASGLNQRQQHLTEVIISAASATAALFDRDDLEPDGVIELTFEMDANNLTDSVTVLDPFIHYVDIHYQTTSILGTKSKSPDFYA